MDDDEDGAEDAVLVGISSNLPLAVDAEDVAVAQAPYDRALFEASRTVFDGSALDLPWESGVFANIFGSPRLDITGPADSLLEPVFPDTMEEFTEAISSDLRPHAGKRPLEGSMHSPVLSAMTDSDAKELETELFEAAITKWQFIFSMTDFSGPIGTRIWSLPFHDSGKVRATMIRDVLGVKSPRTASKRADSMKRYFSWCVHRKCAPWPIFAVRVMAYLEGDEKGAVAASTGMALMEAFRFSKFVMGIEKGEDVLNDPQLKGRVSRLYADNSKYRPARPLLCSEVALLERFVCKMLGMHT